MRQQSSVDAVGQTAHNTILVLDPLCQTLRIEHNVLLVRLDLTMLREIVEGLFKYFPGY